MATSNDSAGSREELEARIDSFFQAADLHAAATLVVKSYGPEILAFLHALHRNEDDASEAFSLFAEGLWRSLSSFDRRCSFRTWAFAIARRVSLRLQRDKGRYRRRHSPLPEGSSLGVLVEQVRTRTLSYLRTERRSRLVELRDLLSPEDRMVLMLRVDRKMAWIELARVMAGEEDEAPSEATLKKEAARLRKRFQLVKERIHKMAREKGLIGSGGTA